MHTNLPVLPIYSMLRNEAFLEGCKRQSAAKELCSVVQEMAPRGHVWDTVLKLTQKLD